MASKLQYYTQMADDTAARVTRTMPEWTGFLQTMGRVYKYPYHQQLMIYAQRPDATACAEYDIWMKQMGRYIKCGSKGIAFIDNSGDYSKIRYLFDVSDTGLTERSRSPQIWAYREEHEAVVKEELYQSFGVGGITLADQLEETARFLVDDYWYQHREDILDNIADSMLSDYDEDTIRQNFCTAAAVSTGYVLMSRCGLDCGERYEPVDFMEVFDYNTASAVQVLGCAVSNTSEQILRQVERTIKTYEHNLENERGQNHERTELHSQRGLSHSGSQTAGSVPGASGQVRQNAEDLPAGASAHSVEQDDSERNPVLSPKRGGQSGQGTVGASDVSAHQGERSDRAAEAGISHGVGTEDERPAGAGGGDHSEGTDLHLSEEGREDQVSFFPTEAEQIEYIAEAENTEVVSSAFSLPQEVLDSFLQVGSNTDHHRMILVSEFSKNKTIEAKAGLLKQLYHGGNGLEINGREYSAWYAEDGIHLAQGRTARYSRTAQVISWDQAADRIGQILEAGTLATNVEIAEAPGYERKALAEKLWYLTSDLSEKGIAQGLLPTVHSLRGGFPAETELLAGFLKDTVSLKKLSQELEAFTDAYENDPGVLRFHYHQPKMLQRLLEEQSQEREQFRSSLTEIPELTGFITEDELNAAFARGSGMANGKDRIYTYFAEDHSSKDKADFLKAEYGIGGRSHALSGASSSDESHDSKGIVYKKGNCPEVKITWEKAAKRIDMLIRQDRYLSQEELAAREAMQDAHLENVVLEESENQNSNQQETSVPDEVVIGEVEDLQKEEDSPFVQQVMADAQRIAMEERLEDPAFRLAYDLDQFSYDYDTYEYKDRVSDQSAERERLYLEIKAGTLDAQRDWLLSVLAGPDAAYAEQAYLLMERLEHFAGRKYEAVKNPYSHNELDRVQIQEVYPDGTYGDILGYCREVKAPSFVDGLNTRALTADQVRVSLTEESHKWHCYVIEDLSTWNPVIAGERERTPITFFDSYEEARDRFMELRSKPYNAESMLNPETQEPVARLTFGIQRENPPGAADLLQVRNNRNYVVDDFTRMTTLNTSEEAMTVLHRIHQDLGFDRIRRYEKGPEGFYLPPVDMPFSDWENSYFEPESENAAFRIDENRSLTIQTCDEGFDYTIVNSETGDSLDGGVLTAEDLSMVSAVREICMIQNLSLKDLQPAEFPAVSEPEISETQSRVLSAMKASGFVQDKGNEIQFADQSGYPMTFESWDQAYDWLDTVPFKDNPEVRKKVQLLLHTDEEYAQQHLIPGETVFQWEDRTFMVEEVNTEFGTVDLQDLTFRSNAGFPISRVEHISKVRDYLESIPPEIPMEPVKESGKQSPAENFRIIDTHLGEGTPRSKYTDNIRAIQLLKQLEIDNRQAFPDEQEILSRYVGWGGISEAFDPEKKSWEKEYLELKSLLTPEEYDSARSSTLNAHYTSPTIINAIYEAVGNMGFESGTILEPSCGTGNFIGMLPAQMNNSRVYGVELDSISGRIAQQLYPKAQITVAGFETTNQQDFFDLAVGNVPFGQYKVNDPAYNRLNFSIHNYFFAKTLDQVRPGGVIAFVTTRYTMDAKDSTVRRYLAQRAELLGAIRLPDDAFKKNAGAEVVSDIIFLQKRERPLEIAPDWTQTAPNEQGYNINQYFIDHPEMIMGINAERSTAHGMDYTVRPNEEISLAEQLHEAVKGIRGTYIEAELPTLGEGETIDTSIPADPNVKNYSYTVVDGLIYYRENSRMVHPELSVTTEGRIKGMVQLRDCVHELIALQMEEGTQDSVIQAQQQELNRLYDAFSAKYGLINNKVNQRAMSDDSSYYLLCALEVLDEDQNLKRKADMFTKRTIRPHRAVSSVETASEALAVSISEKACVDMKYMSQLSGKTEDQLASDLQGVIFKVPQAVEADGSPVYETSDAYLSGNVRQKLRDALTAAEKDSSFAPNVEALKAAQPKDLDASEIEVRLGATWIDKDYVQQFMYETFDTPWYLQRSIHVNYAEQTAEWQVEGKSNISYNDVAAYTTFGTERANAYRILEDSLNLRDVRVYDTIEDADGKTKRVLNSRETTLAAQKQQAIREAFKDWIWKDPDRRRDLVKQYNEEMNSTRPREYNGDHIVFGGINPEIQLREHQKSAIAHILYGGNTLLAHEVGAGKTYEIVAACMESKRLGLSTKALIAVPNHLTEQWASEFLQLYPAANILVTTKKDFEPANRKRFCARIATGDYDAIIMGHSQFEKIPISRERQEQQLQDQIDEITEGISELSYRSGERFTVKQLEKLKKSLEQRLEKLQAQERKDDVVSFEELGIDRLFVDEAHEFKNLFLYTKMRNVAGLSTTDAQKSSDMFAKCRYMDEKTGSKGVIFATGTPVSNSMTELYTMQRYLQYDRLKELNMTHFDCWASRFGETVTALELAPEGYTQLRR